MLKISVIVITKNRPLTLKKTVESLIGNTKHPYELIIVDSSETNTTQTYIRPYLKTVPFPCTYKKIQAKGIAKPLNTAFRLASGDVIAKIDDDEYADTRWVEMIIQTYRSHPNVSAITGAVLPTDMNNYWQRTWAETLKDSYRKSNVTQNIYGSNAAYRKEVFQVHNLFINEHNKGIAAEDSYISFMMRKKNLSMYHNHTMKVFHDFRNTFKGFALQWLNYGMADYQLWMLYPEICTSLSASTPTTLRGTFSVARSQTKNWSRTRRPIYIPGFFIRNWAYIIGAMLAFTTRRHTI